MVIQKQGEHDMADHLDRETQFTERTNQMEDTDWRPSTCPRCGTTRPARKNPMCPNPDCGKAPEQDDGYLPAPFNPGGPVETVYSYKAPDGTLVHSIEDLAVARLVYMFPDMTLVLAKHIVENRRRIQQVLGLLK